ncbi:hypothetical protein RIF29_26839 [Crotalaria pallida]|uniref:Uncharacterized protein n=1 Tax=Crotalaria pallida TaxID=3830 RepID=A0AAN9EP31_CROPI
MGRSPRIPIYSLPLSSLFIQQVVFSRISNRLLVSSLHLPSLAAPPLHTRREGKKRFHAFRPSQFPPSLPSPHTNTNFSFCSPLLSSVAVAEFQPKKTNMGLTPKIAPSMLSSDFANLASEAHRMLNFGADWLHMDIMDG